MGVVDMTNDWKRTLKITENKEEKRILELQRKIKANEINEEDLTEEDYKKLIQLYTKQNQELRKKIEIYRQIIKKKLKK